MNVPNIAFSAFNFVISGIDDSGSGLDPIAFDHLCAAYGGDEDVGFAATVGEVEGFAVGDGDGGVSFEQHQRHGLAEDVAPTNHECALSGDVDVVVVEDFGDTKRGGAPEAVEAGGKATERGGRDSVGVLLGSESEQGGIFVEVFGKRVLEQNAVDFGVGV